MKTRIWKSKLIAVIIKDHMGKYLNIMLTPVRVGSFFIQCSGIKDYDVQDITNYIHQAFSTIERNGIPEKEFLDFLDKHKMNIVEKPETFLGEEIINSWKYGKDMLEPLYTQQVVYSFYKAYNHR